MSLKNILNLVCSVFLLCIMGVVFSFVSAAPDLEMTYHGKLTDTLGISVPNGSYDFTIRIFDQEVGGTCLWSARGTCGSPTSKTLTLTNGIFSTTLGESGDNPLNLTFSDNYYLEIQIDANPAMTPRRKITPTGFALNSHRLNGQTEGYYLNTSTSAQTKLGALSIGDDFSVNSDDFFVDVSTNHVGIGTASPGHTLDVKSAQSSGTIIDIGSPSAVTLSGKLIGQSIDLSTGYSYSYHGVTGSEIMIDGNTSTSSSGVTVTGQSIAIGDYYRSTVGGVTQVRGVSVNLSDLRWGGGLSGGTIVGDGFRVDGTLINSSAAARNTRFNGLAVFNPTVTQTAGSSIASGVSITTNSITTDGTQNGVNIIASGVDAGDLYGLNISSITPGSGSEIGINIGSGWDYGIYSETTGDSYFAGNVGIGTNNPNHPLHLYGTTNGGADIYSQTDGGRSIKHWFANAGHSWSIGQIGTIASPSYQFRITDETAGLTRLGIDVLGNVGIGTTSASERLTVSGAINIGSSSGANAGTIRWTGTDFEGFDGSSWASLTPDGNTTEFLSLTDTPSSYSAGSILFTSGSAVTEDNDNLFWDDVNKRLGIATNTPSYDLDVFGTANSLSLITQNLIFSHNITSILNAHYGFDGYTNFSGGIGTGGTDSLTHAQRITDQGDLVNIGSIQAGETHLTRGGSFASKVDYAAGLYPEQVAIGDVNGDGKNDIALTNQYSNSVSIFLNNGNGTFAGRSDYVTGTYPYGVEISDLNGDGKTDVVTTNFNSNSVSIFLNNGDGSLASKVDYATAGRPRSVVVEDLDGDGLPDISTANFTSNSASVLLNNGDGTFAASVNYATASGPYGVAKGDVNGDGYADLMVTGYYSSRVSVLLNNGDGTFAPRTDYVTGTYPSSVSVGDLDGDNKPEIAVANYYSDTLSLFANNGDGTFASKVDYSAGDEPYDVAMGDMTGDGYLDLSVTNQNDATLLIFANNGDGTFATPEEYDAGGDPRGMALGDVNSDGKPDIAVANQSDSTVSVFLNESKSMFYADAQTGFVGIGTDTPSATLTVAGAPNPELVASGSVTRANMRMSKSPAFVDFSSAGALIPYEDHRVIITDSDGEEIEGYIKDAGSSETLSGTNIITSWTNGTPPITNYQTFTSSGPDITLAYESTTGKAPSALSNTASVLPGQLYKLVVNLSVVSGSIPTMQIQSTETTNFSLSSGLNIIYYVAPGSAFRIVVSNMGYTANWSATFDMQRVLTPSITGVTIVDTMGGTNQIWANEESGFTYNESLGYTYEIYDDTAGNTLAVSHEATGDLLTVANTGNVGIGTDTPDYKLQVDGDIVPEVDDAYDLGTSSLRWRDLYLGPSSLHIGADGDEGMISYDTVNDVFVFDKATVFGNATTAVPGALRWTGTDFEGYDGSIWTSLTPDGNTTTFLGLTDTPASYTAGSLLFTSGAAVAEDNFNLFWNNTAKRLGIGTSSPERQLHVKAYRPLGTFDPAPAEILLESTEGKWGFLAYATDALTPGEDPGRLEIIDRVFDTTVMAIEKSGHVGIGTTNPSSSLDIGNVINFNEGLGAVGDGPDIQFDLQGLVAAHSNMFFNIDSDNNDVDKSFIFGTDSNTSFATQLMSIREDGYVGIGSTPPNEKLEVSGNILLNSPSNNAALIINSSTAGYGIHSMFRMQSTETGSGENMAGAEISRNAYFQTSDDNHYRDDDAADSARLRFDSSGTIYLSNATAATGPIAWNNRFIAYNNGIIDMPGVYDTTTAAAANVYVASNGRFYRSTSSARYKDDIHYDIDGDLLYDLKPASYRDKGNGNRYIGFVAEDVAKVESRLVEFDENGRPDALHYGNFSALITQTVQDQKKLIVKNENSINLKAAGAHVETIQKEILSLREEANIQADVIADIEARLDLAESGIDVLLALSENDLSRITDLLAIDPEKLVHLDNAEGITISGIIATKEVQAEQLTIVGEETGATIGVAAIAEKTYDVFVETTAVTQKSRIFVTARGSVITQPLSVTQIDDNSGFHVTVAEPVDDPLEFDWMIVEDQVLREQVDEEIVSQENDPEVENVKDVSAEEPDETEEIEVL